MRIVINDTPLALGAVLAEDERARAGLRRTPLWQRLLRHPRRGGPHLEASNCTLEAFDGAFLLYPCTDGYLNNDRQWRTAATLVVEQGRLRSVQMRVIDGRYAAAEFVDRFGEICTAQLGQSQRLDRYTQRWKNGQVACLSTLQRDGRNASIVIEMLDA